MSNAEGRPRSQDQKRFAEAYGPWAVVTGASDGIGRAIAVQLAESGVNLVLVSRREAVLAEMANDLQLRHSIATKIVALDLSRSDAVQRLDEATRDIDVGLLVAAAGFGTSGSLMEAEIDPEAEMIDVNCRAVLQACHLYGRRFLARDRGARKRGGIILFGSLVAWQGAPFAANYAATKAYVQSLAEGLRMELGPSGIDVIAPAPGPVHSGFAARAGMVMGSAATPELVARAALRGLGRRAIVVPGMLAKVLTYSLALLPRAMRVRIMAQVMRGMSKDRAASHEIVQPKPR